MDVQIIHTCFLKCTSISIDTRKIEKNSLFVAIKGENYDANFFAKEALDKGALFVIIDNPECYFDERTILVNNSLNTLQELAKFHRNYLKIPIIALTGSNGKTTTKELIQVVLSQKLNTKATLGNLNNHIGVPLTILSFTSDTEIGIVEMGANHQKEIDFLCQIAQPDYGYITNFGKAHLEGFGGVEGVIKGKSELYDFLCQFDKTIVVNLDDPIQVEKTKACKTISFGINKPSAFLNIKNVSANPFVEINFSETSIKSNLIGLYNANNINAAITLGSYFGVSSSDIKKGIESYVPENNRSQLINKNSNEIILDAYNANPSSMAVAIQNFIQLDKPNKVVFLGDMFELGSESMEEHRSIIKLLEEQKEVTCYFIGNYFYANKIDKENYFFYDSFSVFSQKMNQIQLKNNTILIKGSRGMALERIVDFL